MQDDRTTLVCLFHHESQAHAAVKDLRDAGVPDSAVSIIGADGQGVDALDKSELASLGMPDRDYDHLKQGIGRGGVVVVVSSISDHVSKVEAIFGKHSAEQIDDIKSESRSTELPLVPPVPATAYATGSTTDEAVVPVVQEDLIVGKRTVDQGGVRLYRRVVDIPVEESVRLREEHVSVDRVPTDRPVRDADLAFQNRTIELTETAEEPVVQKDARVVEEVVLSRVVTEHTDIVRDTVRRTDVEIDDVPATETASDIKRNELLGSSTNV